MSVNSGKSKGKLTRLSDFGREAGSAFKVRALEMECVAFD